MAAALDSQSNALEMSKIIMARREGIAGLFRVKNGRTLRKVLRKASRRGLLLQNTLLVLQGTERYQKFEVKSSAAGDLNSRTVLLDGVKDILAELIADPGMQAAICHGLPVPAARSSYFFFIFFPRKGNGLSLLEAMPRTFLLLGGSNGQDFIDLY